MKNPLGPIMGAIRSWRGGAAPQTQAAAPAPQTQAAAPAPQKSPTVVGILYPMDRFHPNDVEGNLHADRIRAAGGVPIPISPSNLQDMAKVSAILVPGGGDVDPDIYGKREDRGICYGINRAFDDFEMAQIQRAFDNGMPMLAVCRGQQIMNVAAGGGLIRDIPSQYPRQPSGQPTVHSGVWHPISIDADSTLGRLLQGSTPITNSYHHQAVDANRVGERLKIVARAQDGIVEGVQNKSSEWQFGVQFHPEMMTEAGSTCPPARADGRMQGLYDYLVKSGSQWRQQQIAA